MEAADLLSAIASTIKGKNGSADQPVRLATIDPAYVASSYPGTLPMVTFDGEDALSVRRYAVAGPYRPVANDRVVMLPVSNTYVIVGSIPSAPVAATPQVFTAGSYTWTRPAGSSFWVRMVGGGGAGGGGTAGTGTVASGGSGGGGGYCESVYKASDLAASVPLTVGAAGTGAAGANGGNGGSTTFGLPGQFMTAGGGGGGVVGPATASGGNGSAGAGTGGTATGGNVLNRPGTPGTLGRILAGQFTFWQVGASGPLGAGGPVGTSTNADPPAATGYGAGGGGAVASTLGRAGGDGSGGVIIIVAFP